MTKEKLPVWDLSDYYSSITDPKIEKDLKNALGRAVLFQKKYRGKITDKTPAKTILQAIQTAENIYNDAAKPPIYASLVHSTDSNSSAAGSFMQKTNKAYTEISITLLFFGLELSKLSLNTLNRHVKDPVLANYRNFFKQILVSKPHRLTEPEEKILSRKSLTGNQAFVRLFDEHMAARKYRLSVKGKVQALSQDKILDFLHGSDRELRKSAAKSLTAGLTEDKKLLTYIFNTLAEDKSVNDSLEKFQSPEAARHMSNEIDQEVVDAMSAAIRENYGIVSDYYKLKKNVLGYKELFDYDRYAPINKVEQDFSFEEARSIVIKSFAKFSPKLSEPAEKFFDEQWIDAQPRDGKRGGAYCSYGTPDRHPVVFMNYFGKINDVSTLAHELGHGVNAYLMRRQTPYNYETPLVMAETASVFGEMLVFDDLKQLVTNKKDKQALYMGKIDNIFATVFRQHAMYTFEKKFHASLRAKGELPTEEANKIWRETQLEMYGKSITLTSDYDIWWSYIPHFLHTPFYVYAYAFGKLLVLSLYGMYKKEGAVFIPKYMRLMEAGDTASPQELLKPLGIDLKDKKFWLNGLNVIRDMVQEVKRLK